jgi:hypothetical protein
VTNTPPHGEGCTPGFWKQEQHFYAWPAPYTPTTLLKNVFNLNGFTDLNGIGSPNDSLLDALNYMGGDDLNGAAEILLRAAVSGLLNAASPDVDYALTVTEIQNQ